MTVGCTDHIPERALRRTGPSLHCGHAAGEQVAAVVETAAIAERASVSEAVFPGACVHDMELVGDLEHHNLMHVVDRAQNHVLVGMLLNCVQLPSCDVREDAAAPAGGETVTAG